MHCDLLIQNATIVDGTGSPAFDGDITVTGDRIIRVFDASRQQRFEGEAAKVIDARGRIATPGFIDVHSHSDINILANPNGESKLRQGITTEIVGNCGFSAFPLRGATLAEEAEVNRKVGVETTWDTADGYFRTLEQARPAFNIATFVGHGNIRGSVVGFDDRPCTPDELKVMIREVEDAMDAGALGLSTGLIYTPGMFAEVSEIVELQKAAEAKGGMYASHVRGEGDTLLEAADEFMTIVDQARCQGQFSHLKASGPRNWGKVARVIEQIEQANARGGDVRFDKYPYVASSTELASLLPRWVRNGGRDSAMERLSDATNKDGIIHESEQINEGKDGWDSVLICEAGAPEFEKYQGQSVGEIARQLGLAGGEAFIELLRASRLSTSICNFTMSEDETDMAILHPLGMVCSDAACRAPYGALLYDCPHPRAYGTFGRFFRDYVKTRKLLTLEQAVHKVTAFSCDTFGLKNRGRIAAGNYADLLVIDFPRYTDKAEFARPHQYCEGIDAIIVNGVLTLEGDQHTGNRGGKVLRRNATP
ncbi:MAG: N-acyl-D-amino-acid deacylase family protein [Candidatus Sumerlaeaceae bacterium]